MKNIIKILFVLLVSISASGQALSVTQTVTSTATVNGTATLVIVKTGSGITLTLGTGVTDRNITIVNHSLGDLIISPAIRVSANKTSALLSNNPSEILSGMSSNKVTVNYDGSEWRLID